MSFQEVLTWWSFVFLGAIVYKLGQWSKEAAQRLPWAWARKFYDRSLVFHAPPVAALIALIPAFPMPSGIPTTWLSRLIFGLVAGIFAAYSYKAVQRALGKDTKSAIKDTKDEDAEE